MVCDVCVMCVMCVCEMSVKCMYLCVSVYVYACMFVCECVFDARVCCYMFSMLAAQKKKKSNAMTHWGVCDFL